MEKRGLHIPFVSLSQQRTVVMKNHSSGKKLHPFSE